MPIKLPSHLHWARSGILHFRIAIPPYLRQHFNTREIYRSLRTASVIEATPAAQTLSQAAGRAFQQLRTQSMPNPKKPPQDLSDDSEWGLIMEFHIDTSTPTKKMVKFQTEPHDTPEIIAAALATINGTAGPAPAPAPKMHSPLFSELIEDYKRNRLAANKWTPTTQKENLAAYKLFMDIIGDLPIGDIDEDRALTYVETLKRLPANMNKMPAYRDKSISEILGLNPPPMAPRTINKNLERISSLFKFAASKPQYDLRYNPFSGRSLDDSDGQQREPFTVEELVRIFGAHEHARGRYRAAHNYWLPLMGLLTGARLNELCQLHLSDFRVVEGIHCINIQDEEEGQRLKNKSAKRLVPIHDKLIEVGLIRYVERLRAQGQQRLFPGLKFREKGGYGATASTWFGKFKERCGIMEKHTKVFHSFRHTFISSLLNDDVPETAIAPIVGHEGKLVTSKVYWNAKDPAKRKPTVEKFQPPPEVWTLVPKFEEITVGTDRD